MDFVNWFGYGGATHVECLKQTEPVFLWVHN